MGIKDLKGKRISWWSSVGAEAGVIFEALPVSESKRAIFFHLASVDSNKGSAIIYRSGAWIPKSVIIPAANNELTVMKFFIRQMEAFFIQPYQIDKRGKKIYV